MPMPIDQPLVDIERLSRHLGRALRREMTERGKIMADLTKKTGYSQSTLSQYLGTRPSNNEAAYRNIAQAIGMSDKQFEELKQRIIQEHFGTNGGGGDAPDFDHALSSELDNKPEAIKEVRNFTQFIKQKYNLK